MLTNSIYCQNLEFEFVRTCHATVTAASTVPCCCAVGPFTCKGRLCGCIKHAVAATLRRLDPSQHIVPQQVKHVGAWLALVLLPEDICAGDARVGGHAVNGAAC